MRQNYSTLLFVSIVLFGLATNLSIAQGEANNWYFGQNAGLSFNSSPPTALTDGQINTLEGCSAISSSNGDLIFYTDGRSVWSANHQLMPNGDYFGGTGLNGDPSSTSSGLVVPHPSQDNLFYIFTVDEPHHENAFAYPNQGPANPDGSPRVTYSDNPNQPGIPENDDGFNNGFSYSLVDMNLNGGLGDVVPAEKNIELQTYDPNILDDLKYKCSEKITAVRADDCNAIWVITHFKDTFYAFKIDDNGVDLNPVESQVGPFVSTDDYRRASRGYLKASPSGDKILTANQTMDYDPLTNQDFNTGNIYLFDFDASTGIISNPVELFDGNLRTYGVEFSPDGNKAYASVVEIDLIAGQGDSSLFQWDLESDDIQSTQYNFGSTGGFSAGALQLAPDGKIYRAIFNSNALAVINNPDEIGVAIDYSESTDNGAIFLDGRISTLGLPPFIQSIFSSRIDITGLDTQQVDLCDNESFELFFGEETSSDNVTYIWTLDGNVISGETSETLAITQPAGVILPYEETYTLEANLNDGTCPLIGVANVTYIPFPEVNAGFLEECATDFEQNSAEFDITEANPQFITTNADLEDFNFTYFESLEDAQNNENPIENPQAYTNTSSPQTLGVIVETERANCGSVMELTIEIVDYNIEIYNLSLCDDNQNGIRTFDLNSIGTQVNGTIGDFYFTENDALNEINPINNSVSFQNSNPYFEDVFFTIDTGVECNDLGVLTLEVIELPFTEDDIAYYCVEQFPNPISISANIPANEVNNYEFLWLPGQETTPEIQVNVAGIYEVAITNINTGCTNFRTIEVFESGLANFSLEIEEFFEDNNRVTVNVSPDSLGDYEFSLSPNGPYQESNVFENLLPGIYDIYVRDKNGCGIVQKTFGVLGIMDYFTPNGDGINDVWRFKGVFNNKEPLAQIFIFDRYGKLLKSLSGLDKFWDGFFNGKPMPSQDYWYRIELESGRVLVGHFTLKN
jgi:gliding motility-associated-like protein